MPCEAGMRNAKAASAATAGNARPRLEVARGIGMDNRIGSKFLHAGPGFGGSCFPKDTRALIKTAQDYDAPLRILEVVSSVNDTRKRAMARKGCSVIRRKSAWQDHCCAWLNIQAEHR